MMSFTIDVYLILTAEKIGRNWMYHIICFDLQYKYSIIYKKFKNSYLYFYKIIKNPPAYEWILIRQFYVYQIKSLGPCILLHAQDELHRFPKDRVLQPPIACSYDMNKLPQ